MTTLIELSLFVSILLLLITNILKCKTKVILYFPIFSFIANFLNLFYQVIMDCGNTVYTILVLCLCVLLIKLFINVYYTKKQE